MKNSEVFFGILAAAGFKENVNYQKHEKGIYLDGNAINYLLENLQPEMAEELEQNLTPQGFRIQDIPVADRDDFF